MSKEKNSSDTPIQTSSLKQIEAIVEAYHQALYRFANSLTKNQHEASDLTQQTFLFTVLKVTQSKIVQKLNLGSSPHYTENFWGKGEKCHG